MDKDTEQLSRIEVIWGAPILEDGFAPIPNLIIRNFRKLKITPGEWQLLSVLFTFKHDDKAPFPSQGTLADILLVSDRQIRTWIKGLVNKKLLKVGRRKNEATQKYGSNVYDLSPLIQAVLNLKDGKPEKSSRDVEWTIEWDEEPPEENVPTASTLDIPQEEDAKYHSTDENVPQNRPKSEYHHLEYDNHNSSEAGGVVSELMQQLHAQFGESVAHLQNLIELSVTERGTQYVVDQATYAVRHASDSVVGYFRKSLEEVWESSPPKVNKTTKHRDPRYSEFYELFPDA